MTAASTGSDQHPLVRLQRGARVAVIGAGPSGLVAAKHSRTTPTCAASSADRTRRDLHDMLATIFAEELGVAPDLHARPELTEALLFGPTAELVAPSKAEARASGA